MTPVLTTPSDCRVTVDEPRCDSAAVQAFFDLFAAIIREPDDLPIPQSA